MGNYITVSGGFTCAREEVLLLEKVLLETIADSSDFVVDRERAEFYMKCWRFPTEEINWTSHVFFGGSIRDYARDYLQYQILCCCWALKVANTDEGCCDDTVDAMFYVTDWEDGRFMWEIYNNRINVYRMPKGESRYELMYYLDL
ncbi:hypothetical protein [Chitinophaga sp. Cy-1792]|uniref:hypothetical protein n=1 Tax=Chitinophaga sp. Cy-1792 TaxID=2608339 RepID=UPI00141F66CE|nr:hypothetical protein [Chitinophaga sp. Cy-1792]NIG52796.1 hypothetical protein [Chitinophaga sp. Cy-1792]